MPAGEDDLLAGGLNLMLGFQNAGGAICNSMPWANTLPGGWCVGNDFSLIIDPNLLWLPAQTPTTLGTGGAAMDLVVVTKQSGVEFSTIKQHIGEASVCLTLHASNLEGSALKIDCEAPS